MKKILILLIGILIVSCNQSKKNDIRAQVSHDKEEFTEVDFDWMLGEWKRLNEEEGIETFENWEKISKTEYSGIGFTMQNGDTIKQENIKLIKSGKNWDVTVKVPEEPESITFTGISHKAHEFTVENNEIDFPNTIKYWKDGKKMRASVSNSEMEIPFEFERISK